MQTFMPYPDFVQSARVLDGARLNKQRSETKQILNIVAGINPTSGWRNHPAVKMWRGFPRALACYGHVICCEHRRRGKKDSLKPWFRRMMSQLRGTQMPHWFGWDEFHISHQSSLLNKDLDWYSQFGWDVVPGKPYIWPT